MQMIWRLLMAGVLTTALLLVPALPPVQAAPAAGAEFVPARLVVGLAGEAAPENVTLPDGASWAETPAELQTLHTWLVSVPKGQELAYRDRLLERSEVLYAEPDYLVQAALIPDDPRYAEQNASGAYDAIHAPQAWDAAHGSRLVKIAIVDSGLDSGHPEFAGRVLSGIDLVEQDAAPQDGCGHGTHVAGIAAAAGNNQQGVAGLDWQARILPVRVLKSDCRGSSSTVAAGIVWAVDHGASIINLSLGLSTPSSVLENSTYYAYTRGAALFAASGNFGLSSVFYPAAYDWVMAVGAVGSSNTARWSSSNYSALLDITAPGVSILSTTPRSAFSYDSASKNPGGISTTRTYGKLSGTSMATGFASGAAALLASQPQFNTPSRIYAALTQTATDLGAAGRDNFTGYGLLNLEAALLFDPSSVVEPPAAPPEAVSYTRLSSTQCSNLTSPWIDAVTGGTRLFVTGSDDISGPLPLPISFELGGQAYTSFRASANGFLTFGPAVSLKDNSPIPGRALPNDFIAPFWDDLNPSGGDPATSGIYTRLMGGSPRRFVIEWYQIPHDKNGTQDYDLTNSEFTFEAILTEGSNEITFVYNTLRGDFSDGSSATIGIEYSRTLGADTFHYGSQYSFNEPGAVQAGQAILLAPQTPLLPGQERSTLGCTRSFGLDAGGGHYEQPPFCVDMAAGVVNQPATLHIETFDQFAQPFPNRLALNHYADIRIDPPLAPQAQPTPQVCYTYTAADLLKAGGKAANLVLAVFDPVIRQWRQLPASLNGGTLYAPLDANGVYGVFALRPGGAGSGSETEGRSLPVTGAPLSMPAVGALAALAGAGLLLCLRWRR